MSIEVFVVHVDGRRLLVIVSCVVIDAAIGIATRGVDGEFVVVTT